MMRQVDLLTLFNTFLRTTTMITDILLLLLLFFIFFGVKLFPLLEPSSFLELRAVIRLVDYLKDSHLLSV